jgi:hypothetical protein
MTPSPLTRPQFEALLQEQQALVGLMNDLEYQLYCLGDSPPAERVSECRQAAGVLVGALRTFLYRQDQQVLPLLEAALTAEDTPGAEASRDQTRCS